MLLFCVFNSYLLAQNAYSRFKSYGTLIKTTLKTAPFPHQERANGFLYQGKNYPADIHYSDSTVFIFIPKNAKLGNKIDMVVYLHGWWAKVDSVLTKFMLIEQLAQAEKKNTILVIPQLAKSVPDSYAGKLADKNGFGSFVQDVLLKVSDQIGVKNLRVGNIALAGHSGGYEGIAYILSNGDLAENIKEVYIFDGLYGQLEKFTFWLLQSKGRFVNIFTKNEEGGGTENISKDFMKTMFAWKMPFKSINESDLTLSILENNQILHIFSNSKHNQVVYLSNNFYKFLVTSQYLK